MFRENKSDRECNMVSPQESLFWNPKKYSIEE